MEAVNSESTSPIDEYASAFDRLVQLQEMFEEEIRIYIGLTAGMTGVTEK